MNIIFTKRGDGSERRMVCRVGVHKGTTGAGPAYDWVEKRLIPVYDMRKLEHRCIPEEGITKIKVQGEWQRVEDA